MAVASSRGQAAAVSLLGLLCAACSARCASAEKPQNGGVPSGSAGSAAPTGVNVTYGHGLVCPAPASSCKWGAAANRTGYVSKPLLLDHYSATNGSTKPASGWPALIMVHGGAYWTGDKQDAIVVQRCQAFAARGMAVFSINYRMTGDQGQVPDGWPAANRDNMTWIPKYDYPAVRDTKAAVRWLRANAGTYEVDASKIAMFGESAGACSADGVAMVREADYKEELTAAQDPTLASTFVEQSSAVAAVLDHWGSDDVATQLTKRDGIDRYTKDNAPLAIFHGTADGLVPYQNALELDAGYNRTGVAHQLFPLLGQGHGCWTALTEQNQTQDEAGYAFLARVLRLNDSWTLENATSPFALKTDVSVEQRGGPVIDHPELACPPVALEPNWPTFHITNNITGNATHRNMMAASDANGIFKYKGLFHVMNQPWAHAVSADGAHWYHIEQVLIPGTNPGGAPDNNSSEDAYDCDGTVSFPDLGSGPTPVIMYGPDCGVIVPPPNSSGRGDSATGAALRSTDAPRINVARPADPDDPYLTNWIKGAPGNPGPATFNGIPCSFPGRVWKSKVGAYWNMVCAKAAAWPAGGSGRSAGWARYTTSDPSLMTWTPAPEAFVQRDGKPDGLGSCSGAYFQKLPGGVWPYTHIIQSGCKGASFFLGTYNHSTEVMSLTSDEQSIVVDDIGAFSQKDAYHWGAAGREEIDSDPDSDTGRMFSIAWVSSTAAGVPGFESLVRELAFDAKANRLTSVPLREYTTLRNATYVDGTSKSLATGARWTLEIPPGGARGALDILLSFELGPATSKGGFGVAVRAPAGATVGAALVITVVNITEPDPNTGTRNVTILFTPPPMDPRCRVGSQPCTPRPAGYKAQATVPVLAGESLDLRVLVDRPVIEAFFMAGRTSYVTADTPFTLANSSVHIFNDGEASVLVSNVSAFGMGCGWSGVLPKPAAKSDDVMIVANRVHLTIDDATYRWPLASDWKDGGDEANDMVCQHRAGASSATPGADTVGCLVATKGTSNIWIIHEDGSRNWLSAPTASCRAKALVVPDIDVHPKRHGATSPLYGLNPHDSAVACSSNSKCSSAPPAPPPAGGSPSACPTLSPVPVFPGGAGATRFGPWSRDGVGLRTQRPITISHERAYTAWWRATMLPPAADVEQDIIFGGTCDFLGTSNDCAFYVAYWNSTKRTRPPYVPHDGALLTFVFSNHDSEWIQFCTNPNNFTVTPNETHFIGFSSAGIDQSSFSFVYDGVDRTSELYMCSQGPSNDTRTKDPTGAKMSLRVGVQGGANCTGHPPGAACDGYEGYVGGIRYFNRSLSTAELVEIYHQDKRRGSPPPHSDPPPAALTPTGAQTSWQQRELGGLITWGMSNVLSNLTHAPCDWANRSKEGCKTSGPAMCSGCNWDLDALPPISDFDPVAMNVSAWVETAASFGAKYLVLAAIHAGGFALWPTKAIVPRHGRYNYSVAYSQGEWMRGRDSPDIVKEFVTACRKAGILPGLYVIIGMNMYLNIGADSNSHSVDPGGRFEACSAYGLGRPLLPGQLNLTRVEYFTVAEHMMAELFTNYGELAEVWFDGGVPLEMTGNIAKLLDSHQAKAVAFQGPDRKGGGFSGNVVRWSGTESGHTPAPDMWSTIPRGANGVQQMAWGAGQKPGTAVGLEFVPAEQDGAIQEHNMGGFWYPGATTKPLVELLREYEDSVGHNSNYLLELSPDPQGRISVADRSAYSAFGQALVRCYTGSLAVRQEIGNRTGMVFELAAATTAVDRVLFAEDLQKCGQRVTSYTLSVLLPDNTTWQSVGSGESVGHCRIQRITPVPSGTRIRLAVTALAAVSDADCASSAASLRRLASFDVAGCMAADSPEQPLKGDDGVGAGSAQWTTKPHGLEHGSLLKTD